MPRFSKPVAFFWILRLNRTIMVAAITGTAAFASGADVSSTLWMTLAGWCLAVGGFSLDLNTDRDLDSEGPRAAIRHNPFVDSSLSPASGLAFSVIFIITSFIITIIVAPWALLPWGVILVVIVSLALHLLESPIARALTLGLLQGLYFLMGSLSGELSIGMVLLAFVFFFAMFGGRGMTDVRDFPQDMATRVSTLPKRYGLRRTAWFTSASIVISLVFSLAAYFTGEFSNIYLYLDIVFISIALVSAVLFVVRPTPGTAHVLTLVFMMGTGSIICLAIILGSI
jgi:4-hydroxybenzoate polyprenyltransferase